MRALRVTRLVEGLRTGSSRPLLVEAEGARFVLKLVGGPEGPSALAAEWVGTELARALGFPTLELARLELAPTIVDDDTEWELRDQIVRGAGLCLGTRELRGARIATRAELERATDDFAVPLLWLDVLVENPDRRWANPNVLVAPGGALTPIDHASSLPFRHRWDLDERAPEGALEPPRDHLYGERAARLGDWHGELAARLPRARLDAITASLPDDWACPLAFPTAERQRQAYAAYLWKRLRAMDRAFRVAGSRGASA